MSLKFHNTLGRSLQDFSPLEPGHVRMYTCGPTVYNYAHIGNYRAYIFEDLLRRYLKYCGYRVTQVMNLTDVDDKTIKGSRAEGVSLDDFTAKYKQAFFEDIDTLNIERAEHYPAATGHVAEMIALIEALFEKGCAYQSPDGSVYFKIAACPDYGRLAQLDLAGLLLVEQAGDERDDTLELAQPKTSRGRTHEGDHPERLVGAKRPSGETEVALADREIGEDEPVGTLVLFYGAHEESLGEQQVHRDAKLLAVGLRQASEVEKIISHGHASG